MNIAVLYLIDKLHRAGAQSHLSRLVLGLDRSRFSPRVVCLSRGGPVAEILRGGGVEVDVLGLERIYAPRALRELARFSRSLRSRRVPILHTYLGSANVFGGLAARWAGTPILLTTRRDMGFSRGPRIRWVEETFVNPHADRVIVPCEAIASVAERERHLDRGRIAVLPNGVDVSLFRPDEELRVRARRAWRIGPGQPVLGVVGNFLPVKGHREFIEASARVRATLPEAKFFLVGDGLLRSELQQRVRELGLEGSFVFTGSREDTRDLLALMDVVVLPSHSEGMSNVLLEAMAMARPIVATEVGGNPELLGTGERGMIVPPRDPEALAAAMIRLACDGAGASVLGARARAWVAEHLTIEKMVERYQRLYEDRLARISV